MEFLPASEVRAAQEETGMQDIYLVEWLHYKHGSTIEDARVMAEKTGIIFYLAFRKVFRWAKEKVS